MPDPEYPQNLSQHAFLMGVPVIVVIMPLRRISMIVVMRRISMIVVLIIVMIMVMIVIMGCPCVVGRPGMSGIVRGGGKVRVGVLRRRLRRGGDAGRWAGSSGVAIHK